MEGARTSAATAARRWAVATCVTLIASLTVVAGAFAAPQPSETLFDDAEECLELVPAAASVAGVVDDGREVVLDVHVLLDGVSVSRGADVMRQAQKAYDELKIKIQPTFQTVDFPAQKMAQEFYTAPAAPSSDSSYLFAKSKEAVGGSRPPNTDLVYLLTSDYITGGTAGQADCIGGVRYANRAFAIGEEEADQGDSSSIWLCCSWPTAKIAAHEIAHLLGAHHHYSNCAEGAPAAVEDRHVPTCTLMMTDVGLINLRMSQLEAAVVRGHAIKYADRPPEEPKPQPEPEPTNEPEPRPTSSPQPEPTSSASPEPTPDPEPVAYVRGLSLRLVRHLVARGAVDAGEASECSNGVEVRIERRRSGEWKTAATTSTGADATFKVRLKDRAGRYRAVVDETTGDGYVCSAGASVPARHRHS